ncbi:hypothetical protein CEXT_19311 [Caerostris extrusa]|uniref:Uncharacterized protein n=1 Tax=Caerostris extrusa TaxID=172846 RepID=A0AAV4Y2T3_CAEEX|nr:hypothetical protein CEXT_19311 [Caerostris extrusa]
MGLIGAKIRQPKITAKEMLKRVIITEWNNISSEETSKLVHSMPKRLTEVLRHNEDILDVQKSVKTENGKETEYFATESHSESSFEVIGQDSSSAESTEKVKENSQITNNEDIPDAQKVRKERRFATESHSESSFEVIGQNSSSAEKAKDSSQIASVEVIQEQITEEFQLSTSEDENKDSEFRESTSEGEIEKSKEIKKYSFEISQDSSSAESTEKVKENSQIASEEVIQEQITEEFQESTSEDENKDSEYRESTRDPSQSTKHSVLEDPGSGHRQILAEISFTVKKKRIY